MSRFEKALSMAMEVHQGQVDKAGEPYLKHVLRVAMSFEREELQIVGLLHDVLEDGDCFDTRDITDLFGYRVSVAVALLTKPPRANYLKYVKTLRGHPLAHPVKVADLRDHLREPSPLTTTQKKKYQLALEILGGES